MANRSVNEAVHYIVRASVLAAFAYFVVYLVRTDNLELYIAPRMQFIVKLAALGMYAIAAQQLYAAIRIGLDGRAAHAEGCCDEHGHEHAMPASWRSSLLLYGWFALPLALAFAVPDGLLGSAMASAKGVQFSSQRIVMPESPSDPFLRSFAAYGRQLSAQDPVRVTDERFIETLTTLDSYRSAFVGKTVQVEGFVFRERGMDNRQFGATRFAVSCCSADAYPYGVLVRSDHAAALETNEWVSITGTLSTTVYDGEDVIQIDALRILRIPVPDEPYVSPDLNFGPE
ncbi:TIGR03943 family putative permease subunit [Cohnella sp. GCM10027633]|uniref:TIGR03943 family putative permease subunit n=1 Tax=unclassified Cohnella TaxID=2636738 RepID=UPI00362AB2FB